MSNLTDEGFIRDTIDELEQEAKDNFVTTFEDPAENKTPSVSSDSFFGLLAGLIAEMRNQIQESIEEVYYSFFISTAEGVSLDRAVNPTERDDADFAEVTLDFTGVATTEILGGTIVETAEKIQFATDQTVEIGGGGTVSVTATAVVAGSSGNVPADSITFLPVPITDVDSVTNPLQSVGGGPIEDDDELRTKAISERNTGKTSALDAIINAVSEVDNVSAVTGEENTGTTVDGEGRPPGSFEITVRGGLDADIAQAIHNAKAAGVETFGTEAVIVVDSSGTNRTINFSRPSLINVWVKYTMTVTSDYDSSQDDVIKQLCLDYVGGINPSAVESPGLSIGEDVFAWKTDGVLFNNNNPDLLQGINIANSKLGTTVGSQTLDQIAVAANEEAVTDFDKIILDKTVV
jgi:uncharacterized phage protein gp47/JayE